METQYSYDIIKRIITQQLYRISNILDPVKRLLYVTTL